MENFVRYLYLFRLPISAAAVCITIAILVIVVGAIIRSMNEYKQRSQQMRSDEALVKADYSQTSIFDRNQAAIQVCAPDGINPCPLDHVEVHDSGKTTYIKCFTINEIPKIVKFGTTFGKLQNFPNVTSTIFISEVSDAAAEKELDRHITMLQGEQYAASENDDVNRMRKLRIQQSEVESWARAIESAENTFFKVGFLFQLSADTLSDLAAKTDRFILAARDAKIELAACYGVHAEAFYSNAPYGRPFRISSGPIKSDCIKMLLMDQRALSTVFNYRSNDYVQKGGIYIGTNMMSGSPAFMNIFKDGRKGFSVLVAGPTGVGKSAAIKIITYRMAGPDVFFFSIDSNMPEGFSEGEYCAICRKLNGTVYRVTTSSRERLNPFHIEPSRVILRDAEGNAQKEVLTLELKDSIARINNSIMQMLVQSDILASAPDYATGIHMSKTVSDIVNDLFDEIGIKDGDAESLYLPMIPGKLVKERKDMPTITAFYKKLIRLYVKETDEVKKRIKGDMCDILAERVKELYYTRTTTAQFFTKEEYELLPEIDGHKYLPVDGVDPHDCERVNRLHGSKSYFDGQSTIKIDKKSRWVNIDVSGLPTQEIPFARSFSLNYANECIIKNNSEDTTRAKKIIAIYDEFPKMLRNEYERATIVSQIREGRKRNISTILLMQQLTDLEPYDEGKPIIDNASIIMLFQHSGSSREYLQKNLSLTDEQITSIMELSGDITNPDATRQGEVCIYDQGHPYFVHIDYIKAHEQDFVETNVAKIAALNKKSMDRYKSEAAKGV